MISALQRPDQEQWLKAGSHAAAVARGYHAVAILGEDGSAAATVARGIAGAIVPGRRVILADLVGDVPVLRDLSTEPDPEGVEDSFDFGISLSRIARETPVENFLFIPSGSGSVEREEIFRSGRWTRLARQCRAGGGLLLVAARVTAPGVAELAEQLDGMILLGDAPQPARGRLLHRVELPGGAHRRYLAGAPIAMGASAAVVIAIVALVLWRTYARPTADGPPVLPATVVQGQNTSTTATGLAPANPADSASAAAYAVEMMSANTRAGANLELQRNRTRYPAVTLSAVPVGEARATWYRIIAGAYVEPRRADSLLRVARDGGAIGEAGGSVIRTPYALLVDSATGPSEVQQILTRFIERGTPAYALLQSDGRVFVYVGAFSSPEESASFVEEASEGGAKPLLVFRTGRAF